MQPLHNESKCDPPFKEFHPIIYGKASSFAIAKFFPKNPCPDNGSLRKIHGVAKIGFMW
jgi:hypothetical protein